MDQFLSAKARVDAREGEDDMQELMDTLHRLTTVRATLVAGLSSGLRWDSIGSAGALHGGRLAPVAVGFEFSVFTSHVSLVLACRLPLALRRPCLHGRRNDAPDSALVMRQKWRIAEIRLESYAFVLLSRMLNRLSELGGPSFLARSHEKEWALPIGAVVLALRHMGLGSVETRECLALEQELAAWQDMGQFHLQSNALRLKASVERAQRLVERYW